MTSKIAESLYTHNLARRLPIVSFLELVRITIRTWIRKHNRETTKTTTNSSNQFDLKLQENIEFSLKYFFMYYVQQLDIFIFKTNYFFR